MNYLKLMVVRFSCSTLPFSCLSIVVYISIDYLFTSKSWISVLVSLWLFYSFFFIKEVILYRLMIFGIHTIFDKLFRIDWSILHDMNIHCAIIRFVFSSRFYFLLSLYLPNFLLLFYFLSFPFYVFFFIHYGWKRMWFRS